MNLNFTKLCLAGWLLLLGCPAAMAGFRTDSIPSAYDSIMHNIRELQWAGVKDTAALRNTVTGLLNSMQPNGAWPDINYADRSQTNWTPVTHLDRLKQMVLAYTRTGNYYYQQTALQQHITDGLNYWYLAHPTSTNWYMQQIASPQRVGILLILMRAGALPLPDSTSAHLIGRMASEGGRPDQPGSLGTGANKLDIATHWIYRGCLTADSAVLSFGVAQAYYPIFMTTGEGIQHDLSYMQHGMQLYIGGYGSVLVSGEVNVALNTIGTTYALAGDRLDLLSRFTRNTFFKTVRGKYFHFDVLGRGISRPNALNQSGLAGLAASMKRLDPDHAAEYDTAISRFSGVQPASYGITPLHTHFHKSDYTLHVRPSYSIDVRTVSSRTLRNENGNGENLKGYFLADGATNITTAGDEYYNIFPVWDWARIPGVTAPQLSSIPQPTAWGTAGTSTFTGGVSDSLYGVSTYAYTDNNYSINTTARKSWFFFDEEVLCLGAGIQSSAAQPVNTTVDQCLLNGPVTISAAGAVSTPAGGQHNYNNNLQWVLHNGTGYMFPQGGQLTLSAQQQRGSWKSINSTTSGDTITLPVFKLWFDHGVQPVNNRYAYMIIPNRDAAGMAAYNAGQVRILANTDSMQVVYHSGLNIWAAVFFKAAIYANDSITIGANAGCALLLKNVGTSQVTVHVADPSQIKSTLSLRLKLPGISGEKGLACTLPATPYAGATVRYTVDHNTPGYVPPDPLYARHIYPLADAYVNDGGSAGTNYGTATGLVIKKDNAGYNREIFVKFDLGHPDTSQITKATLNFVVKGANTAITTTNWQTKYVADDSWQENTLTWNNRPASNGILDAFPGSPAGTAVEFDVTGKVKAESDGVISLHIVSTLRGDGKTDATFHSRETADSTLRPQLVLYLKTPPARIMLQQSPVPENKITGLQVTPNPVLHTMYIKSSHTQQLLLSDNNGQILKRWMITAGTRYPVDVSSLPPGIYYLQGSVTKSVERVLIVR